MKTLHYLSLVALLVTASPLLGQQNKEADTQKFYGKITSQNLKDQTITVTNKRRKLVSQFLLNSRTKIVLQKKMIDRSDLKLGQNLIVWFTESDNQKIAKRITVRSPARRKRTKS